MRAGDIGLLFDAAQECEVIEGEKLEGLRQLDELKKLLRIRKKWHHALRFVLNGLDNRLKDETRSLVIQRANELCQDEEVYNFVKERLSRSLPEEADILKAIQLAKGGDLVLKIYQQVALQQKLGLNIKWVRVKGTSKNNQNDKKQGEFLDIKLFKQNLKQA